VFLAGKLIQRMGPHAFGQRNFRTVHAQLFYLFGGKLNIIRKMGLRPGFCFGLRLVCC
jgi:hypothetical protein